ncbi:MAG TPA: exo-beta-N-acetylmuramidase NamZ domain-containing protein [Thermoanaerobaculia bacterium]
MRRLLPLLAFLAIHCSTFRAFDTPRLRDVDAEIERAIAQKKLPGGVVWIEHHGDVYTRAYGNRALEPSVEAMTEDTIFDAASITKVVATAPSIHRLVEQKKVALDEPAKTYLPEMRDATITIRQLLTHTSGLRPSLDLRDDWSGYDEGIRRALAETPLNRPGVVFRYADINYILLGEIVRRVSGQPLDVFAKAQIFDPLGMRDTGFHRLAVGSWQLAEETPSRDASSRQPTQRIAPTEWGLRGVVHDPTSRRMGGVAGHAGLFTTASDLAKFARAVLKNPILGQDITPADVAVRRAFGFDLDSNYSRPRGDLFPEGSFGHTGWTGGFLWIVPQHDAFYLFLSNRVHPDGKGSVVALQRALGTRVAQSLRGETYAPVQRRVGFITGGGDTENGIDVLHASGYAALRGMRIGVITNQSGIDRTGNPSLDLLRSAPDVTVSAIFAPEHGIRGTKDEKVADEMLFGIPVYSLYGERRKPTREQLANLDALVFDVQDIGTRFYTYISTMGLAMEAAADAKIKFIVLDRVNPIGGGVVEGPMLEGETNFTAFHPIPIRHGLTVGELAQQFREERKIDVALTVIPVRGWTHPLWQDESGLPWVNTSPNMRSLNAAALYPGIGLMERALSVGRGTDTPFEILGAPYVDGEALIREVGPLPGVRLDAVRFTPAASTHKGEACGGVRITITDRRALRSVTVGLKIASALVRLYGAKFPADEMQFLLRHRETLEQVKRGEY